MKYKTLQEDVNRLRSIMNVAPINEGLFGRMMGAEPTSDKKAKALVYILGGQNPNLTKAYNQFKSEDPIKADKYVEFFAVYPNGYPKWDGEKFVEQVPTPALTEDGEKRPNRLDPQQKRQVNNTITRITKPTYFDGIPLNKIEEGLHEHGLILLQEDQTEWSGFFTGREGQANIALGFINTRYKGNNDIDTYEEIVNAALTITWYKMGSGKYEIVAYIG
jgi:hypothetical protein